MSGSQLLGLEASLGNGHEIWNFVIKSGSWSSSLGVYHCVWKLYVQSGSWLLSVGVDH